VAWFKDDRNVELILEHDQSPIFHLFSCGVPNSKEWRYIIDYEDEDDDDDDCFDYGTGPDCSVTSSAALLASRADSKFN